MAIELKPDDLKLTITYDMTKIQKHFFGNFNWRKHLAILFIKFASFLLKSDVEFIVEE